MNDEQRRAASSVLKAGVAAFEGRYVEAAEHAADAILGFITEERAQQVVTEAMVRRANRAADEVETARFGGFVPPIASDE